ncbi:phage tail protein [Sphingobium sp.]|uniref:phage tail protein n=1 Tax=Sphingobium sp. TaxID=1912891 RepID=UPI003BB6BF96
MAKVIKTAALVVGAVALVATGVGAIGLAGIAGAATVAGISASTLFLVAGGLSVAGALLTKQPSVPSSMSDRLNATIDPKAFRKTWLGSTAGPVDVRYVEWFGNDQERCGWIVAHASHAIEGVDEIWFDDELAWTAAGGTQGKYNGYFWVRYQTLEGSAANVTSFGSGKWNGSHRLTGCAWSLFEFKVTGNSKKAESPFSGGLPSRITIIGRGGKLYDPRRDSTVPGGFGPMRVDEQSTWRYVADDGATIGENLALHALRVVLGWRINGILATGTGVPGRKINLASWITAANLCDEQVNRSAGGTEPRYHGAGVISEGDDVSSVLDMLCAACCGRFTDTNGRLGFAISHNDLATIATDDGLNDDDVIGQFSWDPDPGTDVPNVVSGKYTDPSNASLYQLVPYPDVRIDSADGIERPQTIDLAWVESPSQAQRVCKQVLQRAQYNRMFRSTFDIRAWKYGVGQVFPFTFAPLGFIRVPFRVIEQDIGPNGTCLMALRFETQAVFAWDADDAAPVQAAAPIIYDTRNSPLIRGIAEAGGTAAWSGVYGEGKPQDNADVTGENTAKDTVSVSGKPAAEVVSDAEIHAMGILTLNARQDDLVQIVGAAAFVDGQPVSTTFLNFRRDQTDVNSALASTLDLIAAKNADGTAVIMNLQTVMASPTQTMAQKFSELAAIGTMDDGSTVKATVQFLQEVFVGDGQSYSKTILRSDVNGVFGAFSILADGVTRRSTMAFIANEFYFVDQNGGNPTRPLTYVGAQNGEPARWEFGADIYAKRIVADVIETKNIKANQVTGKTYFQQSWGNGIDIGQIGPSGTKVWATFGGATPVQVSPQGLTIPLGTDVEIDFFVNMQRTGSDNDRVWFRLRRESAKTGSAIIGDTMRAGMSNFPTVVSWPWVDKVPVEDQYLYTIEAYRDEGGGTYFSAKLICSTGKR